MSAAFPWTKRSGPSFGTLAPCHFPADCRWLVIENKRGTYRSLLASRSDLHPRHIFVRRPARPSYFHTGIRDKMHRSEPSRPKTVTSLVLSSRATTSTPRTHGVVSTEHANPYICIPSVLQIRVAAQFVRVRLKSARIFLDHAGQRSVEDGEIDPYH